MDRGERKRITTFILKVKGRNEQVMIRAERRYGTLL
jgi:hypothetical protein